MAAPNPPPVPPPPIFSDPNAANWEFYRDINDNFVRHNINIPGSNDTHTFVIQPTQNAPIAPIDQTVLPDLPAGYEYMTVKMANGIDKPIRLLRVMIRQRRGDGSRISKEIKDRRFVIRYVGLQLTTPAPGTPVPAAPISGSATTPVPGTPATITPLGATTSAHYIRLREMPEKSNADLSNQVTCAFNDFVDGNTLPENKPKHLEIIRVAIPILQQRHSSARRAERDEVARILSNIEEHLLQIIARDNTTFALSEKLVSTVEKSQLQINWFRRMQINGFEGPFVELVHGAIPLSVIGTVEECKKLIRKHAMQHDPFRAMILCIKYSGQESSVPPSNTCKAIIDLDEIAECTKALIRSGKNIPQGFLQKILQESYVVHTHNSLRVISPEQLQSIINTVNSIVSRASRYPKARNLHIAWNSPGDPAECSLCEAIFAIHENIMPHDLHGLAWERMIKASWNEPYATQILKTAAQVTAITDGAEKQTIIAQKEEFAQDLIQQMRTMLNRINFADLELVMPGSSRLPQRFTGLITMIHKVLDDMKPCVYPAILVQLKSEFNKALLEPLFRRYDHRAGNQPPPRDLVGPFNVNIIRDAIERVESLGFVIDPFEDLKGATFGPTGRQTRARDIYTHARSRNASNPPGGGVRDEHALWNYAVAGLLAKEDSGLLFQLRGFITGLRNNADLYDHINMIRVLARAAVGSESEVMGDENNPLDAALNNNNLDENAKMLLMNVLISFGIKANCRVYANNPGGLLLPGFKVTHNITRTPPLLPLCSVIATHDASDDYIRQPLWVAHAYVQYANGVISAANNSIVFPDPQATNIKNAERLSHLMTENELYLVQQSADAYVKGKYNTQVAECQRLLEQGQKDYFTARSEVTENVEREFRGFVRNRALTDDLRHELMRQRTAMQRILDYSATLRSHLDESKRVIGVEIVALEAQLTAVVASTSAAARQIQARIATLRSERRYIQLQEREILSDAKRTELTSKIGEIGQFCGILELLINNSDPGQLIRGMTISPEDARKLDRIARQERHYDERHSLRKSKKAPPNLGPELDDVPAGRDNARSLRVDLGRDSRALDDDLDPDLDDLGDFDGTARRRYERRLRDRFRNVTTIQSPDSHVSSNPNSPSSASPTIDLASELHRILKLEDGIGIHFAAAGREGKWFPGLVRGLEGASQIERDSHLESIIKNLLYVKAQGIDIVQYLNGNHELSRIIIEFIKHGANPHQRCTLEAHVVKDHANPDRLRPVAASNVKTKGLKDLLSNAQPVVGSVVGKIIAAIEQYDDKYRAKKQEPLYKGDGPRILGMGLPGRAHRTPEMKLIVENKTLTLATILWNAHTEDAILSNAESLLVQGADPFMKVYFMTDSGDVQYKSPVEITHEKGYKGVLAFMNAYALRSQEAEKMPHITRNVDRRAGSPDDYLQEQFMQLIEGRGNGVLYCHESKSHHQTLELLKLLLSAESGKPLSDANMQYLRQLIEGGADAIAFVYDGYDSPAYSFLQIAEERNISNAHEALKMFISMSAGQRAKDLQILDIKTLMLKQDTKFQRKQEEQIEKKRRRLEILENERTNKKNELDQDANLSSKKRKELRKRMKAIEEKIEEVNKEISELQNETLFTKRYLELKEDIDRKNEQKIAYEKIINDGKQHPTYRDNMRGNLGRLKKQIEARKKELKEFEERMRQNCDNPIYLREQARMRSRSTTAELQKVVLMVEEQGMLTKKNLMLIAQLIEQGANPKVAKFGSHVSLVNVINAMEFEGRLKMFDHIEETIKICEQCTYAYLDARFRDPSSNPLQAIESRKYAEQAMAKMKLALMLLKNTFLKLHKNPSNVLVIDMSIISGILSMMPPKIIQAIKAGRKIKPKDVTAEEFPKMSEAMAHMCDLIAEPKVRTLTPEEVQRQLELAEQNKEKIEKEMKESMKKERKLCRDITNLKNLLALLQIVVVNDKSLRWHETVTLDASQTTTQSIDGTPVWAVFGLESVPKDGIDISRRDYDPRDLSMNKEIYTLSTNPNHRILSEEEYDHGVQQNGGNPPALDSGLHWMKVTVDDLGRISAAGKKIKPLLPSHLTRPRSMPVAPGILDVTCRSALLPGPDITGPGLVPPGGP